MRTSSAGGVRPAVSGRHAVSRLTVGTLILTFIGSIRSHRYIRRAGACGGPTNTPTDPEGEHGGLVLDHPLISLRTASIASWIRPLLATRAGASRSSAPPTRFVTRPPASSTRRLPAAASHGPSVSSQ